MIRMNNEETNQDTLFMDWVTPNDDADDDVQVVSAYVEVEGPTPDTAKPGDTGSLPAGLWLVDTGCGHDLVTRSAVDESSTQRTKKITFQIANGRVSTDTVAKSFCNELGAAVNPYCLKSTQWVLSVGKRCMEEG